MAFPTEKDFIKLTRKGNLIPVVEEILGDLETPVSAYLKLAHRSEYAILLESVEGGEKVCRYSFLATNPELVFQSKGTKGTIMSFSAKTHKTKEFTISRTPLAHAKEILAPYHFVPIKGVPKFCGGLIGYVGYDTVRFFEKLPDQPQDDLKTQDVMLALVKDLIIFDHLNHKIKVISNVHIPTGASQQQKQKLYRRAQAQIARTIKTLTCQGSVGNKLKTPKKAPRLHVSSNFTQKQFEQAVKRAKQNIYQGDIIQVVLSQRFQAKIATDPFNIYRALRTVNPSPYMYFLRFRDIHIVGSSPELLVRCENNVVETRPIAGTRPRGKDEKEDRLLAQELLGDPKERAEHVMLVDLGRNDLGRVCEQGTVTVSEFMKIENYSHVMHIVSNVKGTLAKDKTPFDVLEVTFPAGTVSGAPKIRAMEIIDELEPLARGPYAGAVGYFGFNNNLDTCITIRTILIKGKTAYFQAGAGIVADSNPRKEYQETKNKAKAQLSAIELAHSNFT